MKAAVYILLLVTLAYLGESIRMPSYLVEQAKTAASGCCQMKKGQQCPYQHPGKASSRDAHSSHDSHDNNKGCCNTTANCSNCPLCYSAELASSYTATGLSSIIQQHYPEMAGQPLADYAASSWKPPNA